MARRGKSDELREKLKTIHADMVELELRARIDEKAGRVRDTPRIRDVYFSVADVDLRKRLIAKQRENDQVSLEWWREERRQAGRRLQKARHVEDYWWISASVASAALVLAGYSLIKIQGAIIGALTAYFYGRHLEERAKRAKEQAVASAESELGGTRQTISEIAAKPETFSAIEALSGERDPNSPHKSLSLGE